MIRVIRCLVIWEACVDYSDIFRSVQFMISVFDWPEEEDWLNVIDDMFISWVVMFLDVVRLEVCNIVENVCFNFHFGCVYIFADSVPDTHICQSVIKRMWKMKNFFLFFLEFWRIDVSCVFDILCFVWDAIFSVLRITRSSCYFSKFLSERSLWSWYNWSIVRIASRVEYEAVVTSKDGVMLRLDLY